MLAAAACSTQYRPQPGPRVSVVLENSNLAYARDGKTYPHGFAGDGLVEAVSDNPRAREAAETYRSRLTSGFVLTLIGTVCLATAAVAVVPTYAADDPPAGAQALVVGAAACGLAGLISGGALLGSAQTYHWDAINMYNDDLERRAPPPFWPYPPPGPPTVVPLGSATAVPLAPPPPPPAADAGGAPPP